MVYLGVDPGFNGGLAVLTADGRVVNAIRMPESAAAVTNYFLSVRKRGEVRAALEFVRSSPQMGVTSAFSFGRSYERVYSLLTACRIPFDEVHPLRWQRLLDCRTKGDKHVSQRRAGELFPDLKITLAIADALLLAEYRRRLGQSILFHEATPTPAHRLRSFLHTRSQ
jgi:hypothetical protein